MTLVEVPGVQANEDQQELSFRMAKPDVKDWTMLCLAVFSLIGSLVLIYASLFLKGNRFSWLQIVNQLLIATVFALRLDRFLSFNRTLVIGEGVASLKVKGAVRESLVIKDSVISGGNLYSGEDQKMEKPLVLPDDWVSGQPAKLLAALSLIRQGARLDELARETLKQPENPKVVWVEDSGIVEADGLILIVFGIPLTLIGVILLAKSSSDWPLLALGVLLIAVGLYVSGRNWRPEGGVKFKSYRVEGSLLTGKAFDQPNSVVDLASDKLTIQYWNGLTRHCMRIGLVDDKGTFRALTHWQNRITEDLSRIVTAAAAQGNLPEVVKWSVSK